MQNIGRLGYQILCCLVPLIGVGLFSMGLGGYALITGKGVKRVRADSIGSREVVGVASPVMTRVVGGLGAAVGFMLIAIAVAMGLALLLGSMGVE